MSSDSHFLIVMLNVIMQSVAFLNVIMLSTVAPKKQSTSIGLHHPQDGIINPKYKLLHFLTTKLFLQREEGTNF
jgi:hypothetical protein